MTEPTLIEYTPSDGEPESFGLHARDFLEPLHPDHYKPEKRQILEPIGDVISAFAFATNRDDIAAKLHVALAEGLITASGRFVARPLFEDGSTAQLPFRAIIPVGEFRRELALAGNADVDFVYLSEPKGPSETWISYHWSQSHIEYVADGYTVDANGEEWMSFGRWVCTWSAILVSRTQVKTVLGREIPEIRRLGRTSTRPTASNEEIILKIEQMRSEGMLLTDICRDIKHEPGFHDVGNRFAAFLMKGHWKSGPRQKT